MMPSEELVREAAAALVDFGLHVVSLGDDLALWEVGGVMYTSAELLVLAQQFGLVDKPRGRK